MSDALPILERIRTQLMCSSIFLERTKRSSVFVDRIGGKLLHCLPFHAIIGKGANIDDGGKGDRLSPRRRLRLLPKLGLVLRTASIMELDRRFRCGCNFKIRHCGDVANVVQAAPGFSTAEQDQAGARTRGLRRRGTRMRRLPSRPGR